MRILHRLAALFVPLWLMACDEVKQSANEHLEVAKEKALVKMNTSAEKVTTKVREAAAQAKIEAEEQLGTLKKDGLNTLNEAAKAAQEAADRIRISHPVAE